jgi:hypothetical protein
VCGVLALCLPCFLVMLPKLVCCCLLGEGHNFCALFFVCVLYLLCDVSALFLLRIWCGLCFHCLLRDFCSSCIFTSCKVHLVLVVIIINLAFLKKVCFYMKNCSQDPLNIYQTQNCSWYLMLTQNWPFSIIVSIKG